NPQLADHVATAYQQWSRAPNPAELSMLRRLTTSTSAAGRASVIAGFGNTAVFDRESAIAELLTISSGDDARTFDEWCSACQRAFSDLPFDSVLAQSILTHLEYCPDLDGYHVGELVSKIARLFPMLVGYWLLRRISIDASDPSLRYSPL